MCTHQQILQTSAGKFCRSCGEVQIYKTDTKPKSASKGVGIAKIWER